MNMEYTIVKAEADDTSLEKYRKCFEKNGTERVLANLQWLHQQNLAHTNTIYYALQNDTLAAIYTALPVVFKINKSTVPALQSIDTITDIDHRGKGLFPKLANKLYNDAAQNKFALVYGFPNENSAPGFFKKLQWQPFGEAPFLLKPLNPFYFFKKIWDRKKIQEDFSSTNHIYPSPIEKRINNHTVIKILNHFDENYDAIWKTVAENIPVCVNRDAAYMNWRYIAKPAEHYYRYGIYINGKLEGIIVYAIKTKHGGLIGYIMDLIYYPSHKKAAKYLLQFASQQFRLQKVDTVLAWSLPGSFNFKSYRKSGYFVLPPKLRPQKLYLGVRPFDDENKDLITNANNWYISYSDSDTV